MSVGNLPCDIVGYLSPAINCSLWNPMLRRQIRATRFNPESLDSPAVALIQRLLRVGCPPAVSFCIRTIWVNSVNRMVLRPWSHVREKLLKGAQPLLAHANSSAAVVGKADKLRVGAPLDHARPSSVLRAYLARSVPVLQVCRITNWARSVFFHQEASATARAVLVGQKSRFHNCSPTTVAVAKPSESVTRFKGWEFCMCGQPSKPRASEVNCFHGAIIDGHASDVRTLLDAWPVVPEASVDHH